MTLARALRVAALGLALCCAPLPGEVPPTLELDALRARTERARGLRFVHPLDATLLDPDDVSHELARQLDAVFPAEDMARAGAAAETLGLLPAGTDLRRELLAFQGEAVAGFYTPVDRRFFLVTEPELARQGELPVPEDVVVHELTHALQAEHFGLLDVVLGLENQDDLAFALGALLEGDALRTAWRDAELEYGTSGPTAAQFALVLNPLAAEVDYPGVPRAIRERFLLQYSAGYALVEALAAQGGSERVDAALRDPPLSSEQLLHPERYLDRARRDPPRFLELPEGGFFPDPACAEIHRETLGELGIAVWLRERFGTDSDVQWAAEGWGGDRLVVLECPAGRAFAWLLRFDREQDQREFETVARQAIRGLQETGRLLAEPEITSGRTGLLVSAGLDARAQGEILGRARETVHPSLEAFLAAHPEVLARAEELRERAKTLSAPR
jgi:hypothetical protein